MGTKRQILSTSAVRAPQGARSLFSGVRARRGGHRSSELAHPAPRRCAARPIFRRYWSKRRALFSHGPCRAPTPGPIRKERGGMDPMKAPFHPAKLRGEPATPRNVQVQFASRSLRDIDQRCHVRQLPNRHAPINRADRVGTFRCC